MSFRHIIWDWNGTLLDDAWLCVEIINGLLARRGLAPVSAARYAAEFTFPVVEYYRGIGFDLQREPFEALAAEFVAEYDRRRFACDLQPAARQVLAALGDRCQAVLSAYEQMRLEEMIAFHRLGAHFAQLVGVSDCYAHGKIDHGRRLIAALDCPPGEVLLVGDTLHDVEVAAAMGIACALVPSGHASPARLRAAGVPVLGSLDELPGWLGRRPAFCSAHVRKWRGRGRNVSVWGE